MVSQLIDLDTNARIAAFEIAIACLIVFLVGTVVPCYLPAFVIDRFSSWSTGTRMGVRAGWPGRCDVSPSSDVPQRHGGTYQ